MSPDIKTYLEEVYNKMLEYGCKKSTAKKGIAKTKKAIAYLAKKGYSSNEVQVMQGYPTVLAKELQEQLTVEKERNKEEKRAKKYKKKQETGVSFIVKIRKLLSLLVFLSYPAFYAVNYYFNFFDDLLEDVILGSIFIFNIIYMKLFILFSGPKESKLEFKVDDPIKEAIQL